MVKIRGSVMLITFFFLMGMGLLVFSMLEKSLISLYLHRQYQRYFYRQDELNKLLILLQQRLERAEDKHCFTPFFDETQYWSNEKLFPFCQLRYNKKVYEYLVSFIQELPCALLKEESSQTLKVYQIAFRQKGEKGFIIYLALSANSDVPKACSETIVLPSSVLSIRQAV